MNRVDLIGRMTKDPEVRYTQGDNPMAMAKFTIAVDRKFKKDGEQSADFINCTAFKKTAEFIEKYFGKGNKIAVSGRIQTGSYDDKDGKKVHTTEVVVEEAEFVEKKESAPENNGGFENIPEGIESDLPFSQPMR